MLLLLLLTAAPAASTHLEKANALLDRDADPWAYEQARIELIAALASAPDDAEVQVAHARWLRREGQLDAAQTAISAVRERWPSYVPAMVEEGELALERDCQHGGERAFELASAALEIAPKDPRAWLLLSRVEVNGWGPRIGASNDADKLRHSEDRWVAKQAQWLLADVYEAGDRKVDFSPLSERCHLQRLSAKQRTPDARAKYATWLLHRERYEEAAKQASLALELGAFVPAQQVLAVALRKQIAQAQPEEAKQLLQRSDEACDELARLGGRAAVCAH